MGNYVFLTTVEKNGKTIRKYEATVPNTKYLRGLIKKLRAKRIKQSEIKNTELGTIGGRN